MKCVEKKDLFSLKLSVGVVLCYRQSFFSLFQALRISMEEQRQRQEDVTKEPGDGTTDKPIAQPAG